MKSSCFHLPLAVSLWCATFLVPSALHADCCGGGSSMAAAPSGTTAVQLIIDWDGADDIAQIGIISKPTSSAGDGERPLAKPVVLKHGKRLYSIQMEGGGGQETCKTQLQNRNGDQFGTGTGTGSNAGSTAKAKVENPQEKKTCEVKGNTGGATQEEKTGAESTHDKDHADADHRFYGFRSNTKEEKGKGAPGSGIGPDILPARPSGKVIAYNGGGTLENGSLTEPAITFVAEAGESKQRLATFTVAGAPKSPAPATLQVLNVASFGGRGGWDGQFTSDFSGTGLSAVRKFRTPDGLTVVSQVAVDTRIKIAFYPGGSGWAIPAESPQRLTTIERVESLPAGGFVEGIYPAGSVGWKSVVTYPQTPGSSSRTSTQWTARRTQAGLPELVSSLSIEEFDGTHKRFTEEISARPVGVPDARIVTTKQWLQDGTLADGTTGRYQLLSRSQEVFYKFGWGESRVSSTLNSTALAYAGAPQQPVAGIRSNLTTTWEYWSSAGDGPNYGEVRYAQNWDGGWTVHLVQEIPASGSAPAGMRHTTFSPWKNCLPPGEDDMNLAYIQNLCLTPTGSMQKEVHEDIGDHSETLRYAVSPATPGVWTLISRTSSFATAEPTPDNTSDSYASTDEYSHTISHKKPGHPGADIITRQFVTGGSAAFVGLTKNVTQTGSYAAPPAYFTPSTHYDPKNRLQQLRITETQAYDNYVDASQQTLTIVEQSVSRADTGLPYLTRKILEDSALGTRTVLETRRYVYDGTPERLERIEFEGSDPASNPLILESWIYPDELTVSHTGEDGVETVTKKDVFGRVVEERIKGSAATFPFPWWESAEIPAQPDVVTLYTYSARSGDLPGVSVSTERKAVDAAGAAVQVGGVEQKRTLASDSYDGTGVTISHFDQTSSQSTTYLVAPGTVVTSGPPSGRVEETRLGYSSAANPGVLVEKRTYFQDGRLAKLEQPNATPQTLSTWYNYKVLAPYRTAESVSSSPPLPVVAGGNQDPNATDPNLSTLTMRDGLGRTLSVTSPSAVFNAGGVPAPATTEVEYRYDGLGRLSARQLPDTGFSVGADPSWEVYTYGFDPATQSASVTAGRRMGTTLIPGAPPQANSSRRISSLELASNHWWKQEVEQVLMPTAGWQTAVTRRQRLTGLGSSLTTGLSLRMLSLETKGLESIETRRVFRVADKATVERQSRNEIVLKETTYFNGLPRVFSSLTLPGKILYYTPLREPLAEPSHSSGDWPGLTYELSTGRVASRLLTDSPGPATESYTYYTGNDLRAGRLATRTTLTNPGGTTTYDYNGLGQLTSQTGTGDYPVAYGYDAQGRLHTMTTYYSAAAAPATTTWDYVSPALSWVLSKTDAGGKAVAYTYCMGGALKTRKWARSVSTTYLYDVYGRLNNINYSDSTPDVTFVYDTAGRVSERQDGAGTHFFTWTPVGRLELESVSGGLCNGLQIDPHDDLLNERDQFDVSWGSATSLPVYYEYTNCMLTKVMGGDFSGGREVILGYTGRPSPSTVEYWVRGETGPQLTRTVGMADGQVGSITYTAPKPPGQTGSVMLASLNYSYDGGRVTDVTRENNNQWHYEYDSRSQVAAARKRYAAGTDAEILGGTQASYAYDAIGNRTSWSWGGGKTVGSSLRVTTYGVDSRNRYTSLINPQTYDVTGRRNGTNSVVVTRNGAATTLAGSDFQSGSSGAYFWKQLTHEPAKGRYDSVSVTTDGIPAEDGKQYIPAPTTNPTYDDDGNILTDGRLYDDDSEPVNESHWTYTWDAENRLTSMTCEPQIANSPAGAIAAPGYRLTFFYDGLSRRIAKKTEARATISSAYEVVEFLGFAYDGWNMVMSVRLGASSSYTSATVLGRVASYVWGPDIGSTGYANADWQKAGGVGGLLMVLDGVSTTLYSSSLYTGTPTDVTNDDYFPLFDRLGNIIGYRKAAVSTATVDYNNLGGTGALYDYDAFGRELRSSGPAADLVPFHFSTKFTDQETGLNYYGYRYYDPQNGRWLGRDPIGEQGGANLYQIVSNSAPNIVDSKGRIPVLIGGAVLVGAGVVGAGIGWGLAQLFPGQRCDPPAVKNLMVTVESCQILILYGHYAPKTTKNPDSLHTFDFPHGEPAAGHVLACECSRDHKAIPLSRQVPGAPHTDGNIDIGLVQSDLNIPKFTDMLAATKEAANKLAKTWIPCRCKKVIIKIQAVGEGTSELGDYNEEISVE